MTKIFTHEQSTLRHNLLNMITVTMLQLQELESVKLTSEVVKQLATTEEQLKKLATLLNQHRPQKRSR